MSPGYGQAVALCREVCAQLGAESAELGVTHLRHAMSLPVGRDDV